MKAKNVLVLVGKDLRMSKWMLAAALCTWALPILLATTYVVVRGTGHESLLMRIIGLGTPWSFYLAFLVIPAVIGYVLTAEGTDRSAGFLAYMPFTRLESLAGKAISAAMMTILLLGLNAMLIAIPIVMELSSRQPEMNTVTDFMRVLTIFLLLGVAIFGTTWGAAMCLRSAAIAMAVGLGLPLALLAYQAAYYDIDYQAMMRMFVPWSLGLGVVCFVVGAVVFVKRQPEA